jgi:hypothetical protein
MSKRGGKEEKRSREASLAEIGKANAEKFAQRADRLLGGGVFLGAVVTINTLFTSL